MSAKSKPAKTKKATKAKCPRGRPTLYTPAIAKRVCDHIASGGSLRKVCEPADMPEHHTVLGWVVKNVNGFSDQYREAREAAGYAHADEALGIRHELREGTLDPQTAKVILDALKWGAERMAPKSHSPRQDLQHTSPDGSMTPPSVIQFIPADEGDR